VEGYFSILPYPKLYGSIIGKVQANSFPIFIKNIKKYPGVAMVTIVPYVPDDAKMITSPYTVCNIYYPIFW